MLTMSRYFFHVADGRSYRDTEGVDLPDAAAAREEAVRVLGELLRDEPALFLEHELLELRVAPASGEPIYRLVVVASNPRPN